MKNVTLTVEIDEYGSPAWGNLDSLNEDEIVTLIVDGLIDVARRFPEKTMEEVIADFSETCPALNATYADIMGDKPND